MAANRNQKQQRRQNAYRGTSYYSYGNVAYELQPDYTPYYTDEEEEQAQKEALRQAKAEKRENRLVSIRSIVAIFMLFLGCIAFMAMHVVVANQNLELRQQKSQLAEIKAANAVLSAEMTEQMDLDYIKEEAKNRLGMSEPQPYQIVYIDVPKQSYTIQYAADEVTEPKKTMLTKITDLWKKD